MGCSACKFLMKDKENELIEGNDLIKNINSDRVNNIKETLDSEYLNSNQERNTNIFDFFIDLRSNPGKYIEESKKFELDDILTTANNNKLNENKKLLIQNNFYNLFLDMCVRKFADSKEEILSDLENLTQLKEYEKSLFCVKSTFKNPNDIVWCLLRENKSVALDEILYKNYDFFVVSSDSFFDQIIAYFLFLKKI